MAVWWHIRIASLNHSDATARDLAAVSVKMSALLYAPAWSVRPFVRPPTSPSPWLAGARARASAPRARAATRGLAVAARRGHLALSETTTTTSDCLTKPRTRTNPPRAPLVVRRTRLVATTYRDHVDRPRIATTSIDHVSRPRLSTTYRDHVYRPRRSTTSIDRVSRPRLSTTYRDHVYRPRIATTSIDRVYRPRVATTSIDRVYRPRRDEPRTC